MTFHEPFSTQAVPHQISHPVDVIGRISRGIAERVEAVLTTGRAPAFLGQRKLGLMAILMTPANVRRVQPLTIGELWGRSVVLQAGPDDLLGFRMASNDIADLEGCVA